MGTRNPHPVAGPRAADARVVINLPGRYSLANRRGANGERREFACRAVNLTPHVVALCAPVIGKLGERVIAHIDEIGKLAGTIATHLSEGFIMSIQASEEERTNLVTKIQWLGTRNTDDVEDQRSSGRFVPRQCIAQLLQADGTFASCLIIDLSETGAAVSADIVPAPGTVLAIGQVIGRVTRIIEEGFAIKFIHRQDLDDIERKVCFTFGDTEKIREKIRSVEGSSSKVEWV